MALQAHFTPKLFAFLRELDRNNRREWFDANKQRYLDDVRDPMLRFIADFGVELGRLSRHFVADPRPSGGSMFRIYRDTRFATDKRPYKTNVGAQFRHERGRDAHAPSFYLHLEPGEVFGGGGIWHPEAEPLRRIREAIARDPARWKRATRSRAFTSRCEIWGEQLARAPRGFAADHPLVDDLRRKDFFGLRSFTEQQICRPGFLSEFAGVCAACLPLVRLLCDALELEA